ncbi:MAG: diguanylate cyclase [Bryobacterales bacterium]|nr:diguanylate cyclase [Bryobacterales bacterium]
MKAAAPANSDDFSVFNQVQATASRRIRMRLGLPATLRRAVPVELLLVTAGWLLLCPVRGDVSWTAAAFEAVAVAAAGAALVYFRQMGSRPLEIGWRIILFTRLLSLLSEVTDASELGPRLPERLGGALWAVGALGLVWGLRMDRVRRMTDIDRLKRAISERRQAHRRFVDVVNTVDGVVWEATVNPFRFQFVSRSAGPILGFAPQIWMQQPNLWSERVLQEDRPTVLRKVDEAVRKGEGYQLEYRMLSAEGRTIWVRDLVNVVRDLSGTTRLRGVTVDVTETKQLEQTLRHSANHDSLTGLPNRAAFSEALERAFRNAGPEGRFAVLFLDLDRFKVINDTLGHLAGDAVLKEAASRILQAVRSRDVVARLGGDEFAVLAERLSTPEEAVELASRLRAQLNRPVQTGGHRFALSASVGIKMVQGGGSPREVLRDADTAMYCAKDSARGSQQIFEEAMHARLLADVRIEADIRAGLEASQFEMRFRPVVRLSDSSVAGFECVLVWHAADGREWLPEDYAKAIGQSDLAVQIGYSGLQQALLASSCLSATAPFLLLPLPAALIRSEDLFQQLDRIMRETAARPDRVVLAASEGAASDPAVAPALEQLRSRGFRIGLSDFGAAGAPLSELCRTSIDLARISPSYVARADTSAGEAALLQAMMRICTEIGIEVIVAGVQTAQHRRLLQKLGCRLAQGPLFGPAQDAREIETASYRVNDGGVERTT